MSKHTPGPWVVRHAVDDKPYVEAERENGDAPLICSLYEDVTPEDSVTIGSWLEAYPNAEANARLIAAAPDLFDVLETIALGNTDPDRMIEIAQTAIAKVIGETP